METNEIKVYVLNDDSVKIDVIDNIYAINIKDEKYSLLIMKDYWPLLGEINGSIYMEGTSTYSFENIIGFYTLSHNIFHLIIRDVQTNDSK